MREVTRIPLVVTCSLLHCQRDLGPADTFAEATRLEMEHLEADHGFCSACERLAEDCCCSSAELDSGEGDR